MVLDVYQTGAEDEEGEDIGEMFAVYGGRGGSLKTGSRGNLNRLSPFSVSIPLPYPSINVSK